MNLLTAVLFLPLAAFLIALAIPRASSAQGSRMWALISSVAIFAVSLGLLVWFDRNAAGEQFGIDVPWIGTPNIHFAISVNGVSLWLILLSTFLTPLCVLVSWNSIKDRSKEF
jgi:NADH-quinone oxidoreductase subunit M